MKIQFYGSLLVGALAIVSSFAIGQANDTQQHHCFVLHLQRRGRVIKTPGSVVLLAKNEKMTVMRNGEAFCVPEQLSREPLLDLSFTVERDRVYLTRISMERFQTSWDIDVGTRALTQKGKPGPRWKRDACRVTYHQGEPETGEIVSPCVVPNGRPLR